MPRLVVRWRHVLLELLELFMSEFCHHSHRLDVFQVVPLAPLHSLDRSQVKLICVKKCGDKFSNDSKLNINTWNLPKVTIPSLDMTTSCTWPYFLSPKLQNGLWCTCTCTCIRPLPEIPSPKNGCNATTCLAPRAENCTQYKIRSFQGFQWQYWDLQSFFKQLGIAETM